MNVSGAFAIVVGALVLALIPSSGCFPQENIRQENDNIHAGVTHARREEALGDASSTETPKDTCRKPGVEYPIGITFEQLRAALSEDRVVLIDVRNPEELQMTGKLPKSHNLPLPDIKEAFERLDNESFFLKYNFPKPHPQDTNVVLTCRSGRRVQVAWKLLEPLGYCNIILYYGSYLDWKARNGRLIPVTTPSPISRSLKTKETRIGT